MSEILTALCKTCCVCVRHSKKYDDGCRKYYERENINHKHKKAAFACTNKSIKLLLNLGDSFCWELVKPVTIRYPYLAMYTPFMAMPSF